MDGVWRRLKKYETSILDEKLRHEPREEFPLPTFDFRRKWKKSWPNAPIEGAAEVSILFTHVQI